MGGQIKFNLVHLQHPASHVDCLQCERGYGDLARKALRSHCDDVEAQLRELDLVGHERRAMTKKALKSLIDTCCRSPVGT